MVGVKSVTATLLRWTGYPGARVAIVRLTDYTGPRCTQHDQDVMVTEEKFRQYEREACTTFQVGVPVRCHDYYWSHQ